MQTNFRKLISIFSDLFFFVFFTARLWSLSADSRLINLYSSGKVFQENQWTMPTEGAEGGYVEVTTKKGEIEQTTIPSEAKKVKVLAINITDLEDKVELQDKADNLLSSQIWIKGPENSDGYFTLKNKGTENFLQGDKTPMTSVKGTYKIVTQILKMILKGQSISKCLYGAIVSTKKTTKFF